MQGFGSDVGAASIPLRNLGASIGIGEKSWSGEKKREPPGLGNWDNSCFQNSVIQGLASLRCVPPFLEKVAQAQAQARKEEEGHEDEGKGNADMSEALLGMVQRLNDGSSNGTHLWLPKELKTMNSWNQQDAQEYFSKILDVVDREAVQAAKHDLDTQARTTSGLADPTSIPPANPQSFIKRRDLPNSTLSESNDEEGEEKTWRNPLEGLIAQRVGCTTCGHSEGLSLIPFNCFTVPLPDQSTSLHDIRDCLDDYTKLEPIDGVQCGKCTVIAHERKLSSMLKKEGLSEEAGRHFEKRMGDVRRALAEEEYGDEVLVKRLNIPKNQYVRSFKTKQAVVARAPAALVLHVNRSMFNEETGAQIKNPAVVQFPARLGLGPWMLGRFECDGVDGDAKGEEERWSMDPKESMLPKWTEEKEMRGARYELRAVVTHQGRHENGHYIAWRKHSSPSSSAPSSNTEDAEETEDGKETWYRLSDEDVHPVDEELVLRQGGVFMLFYEKIADSPLPNPTPKHDQPMQTLNTAAMTPPLSVQEAASIPLPSLSDDELDFLVAEDEYVRASPPKSWDHTKSKQEQAPTPPESVSESANEVDTASASPTTEIGEGDREVEVEVEVEKEKEKDQEPLKAIRMRTSSVLSDDTHKGSSESLRLGSRMVSAS